MTKILTPAQTQEEEKLKQQEEAVKQIKEILEINNLTLVVEQLIRIVPKK